MKFNQFEHKLHEIRGDALDDFAEQVALKLRENIEELWYNQYTPEDYERTYELINSIDIKTTKAGRQVYIKEGKYLPLLCNHLQPSPIGTTE